MLTGTVKNWFEDKGFGFVVPDEGGGDVFVHAKALYGAEWLVPGDSVSFECQWDDRRNGQMKASSCVVTSGGKGRSTNGSNGHYGNHNGYSGKGHHGGGYGHSDAGYGGYGFGKGDYFDGYAGGKGYHQGGYGDYNHKGGKGHHKGGDHINGPSGSSGVKVSRWQQNEGGQNPGNRRQQGYRSNKDYRDSEKDREAHEAKLHSKSTYREDLYTTPLDPLSLTREKREEARRIADEIERGKTHYRRGNFSHQQQQQQQQRSVDPPPPEALSYLGDFSEATCTPLVTS